MRALLVFAVLLLSGCISSSDNAPAEPESFAEVPAPQAAQGDNNDAADSSSATEGRVESILCGEREAAIKNLGIGVQGISSATCSLRDLELPDFEYNSVLWEIRWSATDVEGGMYFNANDDRCTPSGGAGCGHTSDISGNETLRGPINQETLQDVEVQTMYAILNSQGAHLDVTAEFWVSFFEATEVPEDFSVFDA